jgi:glycosyltransferase involved in cell wall biosynthesis
MGMPVHNGARYMRHALDSLLAQTYKNFELTISDNASTDGTREIYEEYAAEDKRIRYVRQAHNLGAAGNFNFLKREARGKYFMWAASDDKWAPQFVEKCVAGLDHNHAAVMAFSDCVYFDDLDRTEKDDPDKYLPTDIGLYDRLKRSILMYFLDGKATPIYGLWRREKIKSCVLSDKGYSDVNFIFDGLTRGNFIRIPEILFFKHVPLWGMLSYRSKPYRAAMTAYRATIDKLHMLFSPLFPRQARAILHSNLSRGKKAKLLFWNFFVILRLFFSPKL